MVRFLITLLITLAASVGWAQQLLLTDSAEPQDLNSAIEFLEDPTGEYLIDDLLKSRPIWQPNTKTTFNQSYNDSTWWLRVRIANPQSDAARRLIEISYPVLDTIDVYVTEGSRVLYTYNLGDKRHYQERLVDHQSFVVPVTWQPYQDLGVYFRVKTSSSVQVPLTLWDERAFHSHASTRSLLSGLFFGSMLVIAAYNLLIFLALWERTYILYVGYVMSMALFLSSLGGYSFRYLWPSLTQWNDQSIIVFLSCVVVFGTAFTKSFLKVGNYAPVANRLLSILLIGALLMAGSAFWLPYNAGIVILIVWAAITCILCLWAGGYCWYRKQSTAKYYTIAWAAMLSGGLVLALSKVDLLPSTLLTEYGTHLGCLLEVMLLSFALARRINSERRKRFEAQENALATARRANEELESRVQERTRELESLTEKLRKLSNTDQLTGLYNRRYLDEYFEEEWKRGVRYHRSLALVLLDIDHFKSVNDTHGHPVGDDCLREMALRIRRGLRSPADLPARYGGEEFCLVLPETCLEGALMLAERIRELVEQAPIETSVGPMNITVSAGVYAQVPDQDMDKSDLFEFADQALYQAKRLGRNRVVGHDKSLSRPLSLSL